MKDEKEDDDREQSSTYVYLYIYIYTYDHMHILFIHMYIYIYTHACLYFTLNDHYTTASEHIRDCIIPTTLCFATTIYLFNLVYHFVSIPYSPCFITSHSCH